MRIFATLVFLTPMLAQKPEPTPVAVPETEQWITGSIDLGYRWRTGVAGSLETYRSVVNLGSGPKLIGTDFTIVDPKKHLFDRLDARADGWGGDPYATLHVNAKKAKLYDFNADYRNIAYFNNLPSYADPSIGSGIVLNQQAFDTHRRFTSLQLDLLPGNWLVPYLAFDRDSDTGSGVNAYVAGGNEYPVPTTIRNSQSTYRGGARLEFRRFHVTLEQGGTTFKDDQNVYTAGAANNGNNPTTLIGHALDLTSLSQAYGVRGTGIYSKGLVTANPVSWLDLYGQILYSRPDNNVHYQEYATGNLADLSQLLFYTSQQYLLSAEAKVPHKSGSVGAEIRPLRRVRVLESWLTDRMSGSSSASATQTIALTGQSSPTATLLGYALTTNYSQEQVDVLFELTPKVTLRGGYRYLWGDASDLILPLAELTGLENGKLRQNTGIGGITYRPTQKLSVNGEVETARSGGAYFRTSLYNYEKLRVRARYRITPSLQLAADGNLLNNQNPTPGVHYDYLAHQESLAVIWSPAAVKGWDFQGSYTRSTVRSDINYLIPQTLSPERDFYRDNGHTITFLLDGSLAPYLGITARVSAGGSFLVSSGSRPTSYYQPYAKLTVPLGKQLAWVSEWRYYGFGESFSIFENFRTHLITTGVRFSR
jgi:hypothetical protein